jgi:phage N-6-adenine-methyltransferase
MVVLAGVGGDSGDQADDEGGGMTTGPTIKRGASSGDIWTPQVFIDAVEKRFGSLQVDLAATAENHKAPFWITPEENSLTVAWHKFNDGRLWLNPPYGNLAPWAKKCADEKLLGATILLLVPRSGANWYWNYVEPFADVYDVGRMVFDNCFDKEGKLVTTSYPKDLILAHYHDSSPTQKEQRWRWK